MGGMPPVLKLAPCTRPGTMRLVIPPLPFPPSTSANQARLSPERSSQALACGGCAPRVEEELRVTGGAVEIESAMGLKKNHQVCRCDGIRRQSRLRDGMPVYPPFGHIGVGVCYAGTATQKLTSYRD